MKVSRNYEEFKINNNNRYKSLIFNKKKKKNIKNLSIHNSIVKSNDNIITFCNNTTDNNRAIKNYNYSNINLNLKKKNKMIYYKNQLKKSILLNNNININSDNKYIIRSNTIDYKDEITPKNKLPIETKFNNFIYNYNILRKNSTGIILNKNNLYKLRINNDKNHIYNKSLKNLKLSNHKINLYTENENDLSNSFHYIKNDDRDNNINKIFKIKKKANKNIDVENISLNEDELLSSKNNNDEFLSKELFNLLVKKLNKTIEENEKYHKTIRKLREDNYKLKQKMFLDKKKNEQALNKKMKEIFEIKKSRDNLQRENEILKSDIIKIMIKFKETFNNRNNIEYQNSKNDNMQLNQLDSICSSIGGLSPLNNYSSNKE